ncbi:MAG TPA: serine hydrolase, partial [Kofleriaceae bacterium]|nr:serine hydrolase [Kofleriaceae bacterium]
MAVVVASGACSAGPTGKAPATPPGTPRPAKADALAKSLDDYYSHVFPADEPGGEVLVMKNDQIVFARGYGLADVKTHEKVTTRTLFNLGSISKTFVANAVLILAEQHKLSVDDPIGKYFPEFKNKEIAARVKLRHLLTHTSGLPDNRDVGSNTEFFLTARDPENWHP